MVQVCRPKQEKRMLYINRMQLIFLLWTAAVIYTGLANTVILHFACDILVTYACRFQCHTYSGDVGTI